MSEPAPRPLPWPRPTWLDWAGVALMCATAALAALVELLLVPLYAGSAIVPVSVVLAVLSNVLLPRLARALVPSTIAAAAPFLVWIVVVFVVGLMQRPEGDVVLPGSGGAEWVSYGMLVGGALAGTVTVVISATPRRPLNQ